MPRLEAASPNRPDDEVAAYVFGPFRLLVRRRELLAHGVPVVIGQRATDVLLALVARQGRLVTKDELMEAVWPGIVVEENNLQVHISALRKALGDGRDEHRYLLTVAGRGYLFTAPVKRELSETASSAGQIQVKAPGTARHNLPQQLTTLIGREPDLAAVARHLERDRLITLTGEGGVGKTRLAIESGARLIDRFSDGVWLVELAPLNDPKLVIAVIAETLGAVVPPGAQTLPGLVVGLKDKRVLLIADNCEHLIGEVARVIEALIRGCPALSVLASSRERLAIAGERVCRVPSLAVPESDAGSPEAVAECAAVKLFVERAAALGEGFSLGPGNAEAVASICRRLDGIPLAIELAAPRLNVLTPEQLARGLDERFRLLTGGSRTSLPRQQTLHALIEWSYELLNQEEKELLQRLSVFSGPAALASILTVASTGRQSEGELVDLLSSLVERSLVLADLGGSEPRYRMLESTRYYATEKLGAEGNRIRRRHAEHFVARMAEAARAWETAATEPWLASHGGDVDNLRAALEWSFGPDGNAAIGLDLVGHSHTLWSEFGLMLEHRHWVATAVQHIDAATSAERHARVLSWQAGDVKDINDPCDADDALRAASLHAKAGDKFREGQMLMRAGIVQLSLESGGNAEKLLNMAHEILKPFGPTKSLARCLSSLASARLFASDMAAARLLHAEAVKINSSLRA